MPSQELRGRKITPFTIKSFGFERDGIPQGQYEFNFSINS